MSYDELVGAIDGEATIGDDPLADPKRILALPDGSVDDCYTVRGLDGDEVGSRKELGRQLLRGDGETFTIDHRERRPGGQAVNVARQAHAVGEEVLLIGHLDHPLLDFPFETRSVGEPARIRTFAFEDGEVLFAENGIDRGATEYPIDVRSLADHDAVCAVNWISHPDVGNLLADLTAAGPVPVVVDPGALGRLGEERMREFGADLAAADPATVVVSANSTECEALAGAVAGDEEDLESARSALGIAAVVRHGEDAAVAATRGGTYRLPTLPVEDVALTTGAGDRFSAGLTSALARGWDWGPALALGNACSAYFVATGESGDLEGLEEFVRKRR